MVTQETIIIYRLVVRNHAFDAFLKGILFLAVKWTWAPRDLKTQPKSWPSGWTFWVNRYLENMALEFKTISEINRDILNFITGYFI